MPPLVPPGGHRHGNDHKRSRRSPDRNGFAAKRQKVDNPPGRDANQTVAEPGKLAMLPKPPSPTERHPRSEQSTDPRRRKPEVSSDLMKRPLEPVQNQKPQPSTEAAADPRLRRPSKPNIPTMVPLSSAQHGSPHTPVSPVDTMSPSTAPRITYFEPNISNRRRELKRQIADLQTEVCTLAVARKQAKDTHEDLANTAPKRGSSGCVQQAQAKEALERLESAEAELSKAQEELYGFLDEDAHLQEKQLNEACDNICRRFSEVAGTKSPVAENQWNKDETMRALEAKFDAKLDENSKTIDQKFESKLEATVDSKFDDHSKTIDQKFESKLEATVDAKFDDHSKTIDQKLESKLEAAIDAKLDDHSKTVGQKFESKFIGAKAIMKTEMEAVIDKKVALGKSALKEDMLLIFDQKLDDGNAAFKTEIEQKVSEGKAAVKQQVSVMSKKQSSFRQRLQDLENRVSAMQNEDWELQKAGLTITAVQKWTESAGAHSSRIKALEEENKRSRRSSTQDFEDDLKKIENRTQTLEKDLAKLNRDLSANDLRPTLSSVEEKIKTVGTELQNLQEAWSADESKSNLEQLWSSIKSLQEQRQEDGDISNLKADVAQLKSETKILGNTLEKHQEASAANDPHEAIRSLQETTKALEERHELLQTADYVKASTLDGEIKKLHREGQGDIEELRATLNDLVRRVTETENHGTVLESGLEWIRHCVDHRSDDFMRMPLYRFMCKMQMSSRHGGNSHYDNCATRELLPHDFKNYFDPATYEYKETPLAAYLSDRFRRLEQDAAQYTDDRVKEVNDRLQKFAQSVDARCKELEEQFGSQKIGDLWDRYADVANQVKELCQKVEEKELQFEGLLARAQGVAYDETSRCLEELRQRCDQLEQENEARPRPDKVDGAVALPLSKDVIKEIASEEVCNYFEKEVKSLETQAKIDGRRLRDRIAALEQVAKDLKDLQIIKYGQGHLDLLNNNLRDFQDNFLPPLNSKLSSLEKQQASQAQLFPDLVERAKQQEMNNQNIIKQIGQLQLLLVSMAKRFVPAHHVPPEWEMTAAPADQGGHARIMPARPHPAVQGVQHR